MMFRARTRGCLVLMGFVVGCLLSLSGVAAAAEPAPFQTYMVPMRDGVRLATDVQLPPGEGPWPVVLLRTCYDRKNSRVSDLKGRGYVLQDVRGRFDSEGRAVPFADDGWGERQDGLDTVRWILKQPWSNGKIATTGGSALGITQNLLAGTSPPGVVAQRIWVAPGSLYHHGVYPGGAFREGLWLGWLQSENWPADNGRLFQDHPSYDDFWKSLDTTARIEEKRVNIPAFHMGGWFDLFKEGTIASFVTRSRIANNQWLVMGPWPHSEAREVGELVFPPNALETPLSAWRWSEYWLEGKPNGLLDPPRLYYYVMGACGEEGAPGNEWRTADGWPIPAKETEFFVARDGQLVGEAPAEVGSYSYVYDPSKPVPTRGGNHLFESCGPMDQRELEKRADVLVFSTPPLPAPVEVTGQVRLRLAASSSATDTMFTAKGGMRKRRSADLTPRWATQVNLVEAAGLPNSA